MVDTSLHFLLASTGLEQLYSDIDLYNLRTPAGKIVQLSPKSIVFTCPNSLLAELLGQLIWCLCIGWALFGLCYLLRFVLQYFGNIPVFQIPPLRFAFLITKPANQFFLGWLPCIGGLDLGVMFSYFLFDRIDWYLNHLVIIDSFGVVYNLNA